MKVDFPSFCLYCCKMRNFFWRAVIFSMAFLLLGAVGISHADDHEQKPAIRLVTLYGYAPYCFTTPPETYVVSEIILPGKDSQYLKGYSWDVVREALHRAGYTLELTVVPWKRAYSGITHGEYDILFPATQNEKRLKHFSFGKTPVNDSRALLYVRRDDPMHWNGLENLPNIEVAMLRGFTYGDAWDALGPEAIRKVSVNSIEQGFAMLLRGRVHAFAGYEANWDYVARRTGVSGSIRKLPVFNEGNEYPVALRTNTRAVQALRDLDASLKAMLQNGDIKRFREKWHLPDDTPPTP